MKIVEILLIFVLFASLSSAYNFFQGPFKLTEPCFDVYDYRCCNCPLEEVYTPSYEPPAGNTPTTKLFLFTGKSKNKAEQIHLCGGRLPPRSTFNASCPTEIFIHGFGDGVCRTAWMREIKEQLFQRSDCYNVILVDWTWGNLGGLAESAINGKAAGQQVAYSLKQIARQKKYDCKNYHIVAHSFGVVVASYAGKSLQDSSCRLGRITALDAGAPVFLTQPEENYLVPSDASFVDLIHVNAGYCVPFTVGTPRLRGHVDIFVNDGVHQKSCFPYLLISYLKLDFLYATASLYLPLCYHLQATQYYKTSINAYKDDSYIIAVKCDSREDVASGNCPRNCEKDGACVPLGMDLPLYINTTDGIARKIFQAPTSLMCPYADHSGFTGLPLRPLNSGF